MYTVYVAAPESLQNTLTAAVKSDAEAVFIGISGDLRQALDECALTNPGCLVIHDDLLVENIGLMDQLAQAPYPIILIGPETTATAKRALAIRARDLVGLSNWEQDLETSLPIHATKSEGAMDEPGRVQVVFSSKGGVGKTTIAVNLALALAKSRKDPVALVDLDLQFGDVATLVGILPQATIYDVVAGEMGQVDRMRLERALINVPGTRVNVLAAPLRPEEADEIHAERVVRVLQLLRETHAFVVVDTGPGYSDVNVSALDFCDDVLTVCTPDVVTIRTIGQAMRVFREGLRYPDHKVKIILNRAGSKTGVEPQDIEKTLATRISYQLPSDGSWPVKAANQGRPLQLLNPDSLLSRALTEMAQDMVENIYGPSRNVRNVQTRPKSMLFSGWRNRSERRRN